MILHSRKNTMALNVTKCFSMDCWYFKMVNTAVRSYLWHRYMYIYCYIHVFDKYIHFTNATTLDKIHAMSLLSHSCPLRVIYAIYIHSPWCLIWPFIRWWEFIFHIMPCFEQQLYVAFKVRIVMYLNWYKIQVDDETYGVVCIYIGLLSTRNN